MGRKDHPGRPTVESAVVGWLAAFCAMPRCRPPQTGATAARGDAQRAWGHEGWGDLHRMSGIGVASQCSLCRGVVSTHCSGAKHNACQSNVGAEQRKVRRTAATLVVVGVAAAPPQAPHACRGIDRAAGRNAGLPPVLATRCTGPDQTPARRPTLAACSVARYVVANERSPAAIPTMT